jgi:L-fuconolactonase
MAEDRDAWLAQVQEDALEPGLAICDPHHHFWDREGDRYLLEELLEDTGTRHGPTAHNIVSTVFVQCRSMYRQSGPEQLKPVGETEFVQGIAAQSASGQYGPTAVAAGIVGHADLTLGAAVDEVLEAHVAASPNRFRGIRHSTVWDPKLESMGRRSTQQGLMGEASFREGLKRLAKYGLTFDAWHYHHQLGELVELARAVPEVTIVLCHVGGPLGIGPYERDEVFDGWKRDIERVARCPNVVVKLGGLSMPICGFEWHTREIPPSSAELAEATAPYFLHCIEQFGPKRSMFESNFPVDKASCSYGVLWNSFKRIASGFSGDEKASLFHDTATRVYRI